MADLLIDQLRIMADHLPDKVAYVQVAADTSITFADWDTESDRLAGALVDAGVAKGDRVAVYLPPEEALEWMISYSAVHKAGAVAVPVNTRLAPRELEEILTPSGAVAALTGAGTTEVLHGVRSALPALGWAATTVSDPPDGFLPWREVSGSPGRVQVPIDGDDMADIVYTSGTTGRAKGVVVRHHNAATIPNGLPNWTGDGWLHASPLFTFAGIASVYNPMKLGMTGLYQPRFEAGEWLSQAERRRPAAVFLVPSMAQLLVAHPRFDDADLSSILLASLGSAPVAPETLRRLQDRMPHAWVSNNWGMTEAGSAFCMLPPEETAKRIGSVGKPVPPVTFRIVEDDGNELGPREVGELLVCNPGKEREYFNDEEATSATWRDGWLHTGDLAYLDEDGYLYIVGRKKDVIIRGGNNIYATDVESVLMEYDGIQEAAVVGVPHAVLGEDVAAWIVPRPGMELNLEKLRSFLAERLSDYKTPRQITVVEDLPRNATGKVLKRLLVDASPQP
ncbi:MAG: class I adenylate-forming enzyme family protein [Acidimicrobiales bacterium]